MESAVCIPFPTNSHSLILNMAMTFPNQVIFVANPNHKTLIGINFVMAQGTRVLKGLTKTVLLVGTCDQKVIRLVVLEGNCKQLHQPPM